MHHVNNQYNLLDMCYYDSKPCGICDSVSSVVISKYRVCTVLCDISQVCWLNDLMEWRNAFLIFLFIFFFIARTSKCDIL